MIPGISNSPISNAVSIDLEYMLRISNVPTYPLRASVEGYVSAQTRSTIRLTGESVNISHGNRNADDLQFLGWWRGIINIPVSGTHLETFQNNSRFLPSSTNQFTMPVGPETLTALWGRHNIVGPARILTIANFPHDVVPAGQMTGGIRMEDAPVSLSASGNADGWEFLGWANAAGTDFSKIGGLTWAAAVSNGHLTPAPSHMPRADLTVYAIWGRGTVIDDYIPTNPGNGGSGNDNDNAVSMAPRTTAVTTATMITGRIITTTTNLIMVTMEMVMPAMVMVI